MLGHNAILARRLHWLWAWKIVFQTLQKPLIYPSNTPVLPTVFEEKRSNNDK
jgi:hypothetical protein